MKLTLTSWILIALAAGAAFGLVLPGPADSLGILGDIFLRLINSIIAPLMFATLVVSVARSGSLKNLGRIGGKALLLFTVLTTVALVIGAVAALIAQPGAGIDLQGVNAADAPPATSDWTGVLLSPFPTSIFDALARGDVLQIVVFALLFGSACAAVGGPAEQVIRFCESLEAVMFRYTDYVMYAAPIGIFGAMAAATANRGAGLLLSLGSLVLTVYLALLVFVLFILGPLALLARIPQRRFFNLTREPFALAFSTTSSNVALPVALENMQQLGVPRQIAAMVLPLSMSFNTTGSALFLSLSSVFVAQAAGVELSGATLTLMILTLMLTTKGIGAVPRGSLVILAGTLTTFGLPLEGVAIILGIDQLMDMARTSVNMIGHCLATAVVARWEGVDLDTAGSSRPAEMA